MSSPEDLVVSAENERMLRRFIYAAERLGASAAIRSEPMLMRLCVGQMGRTHVECHPNPSDDELGLLLHRLRPFVRQNEDIHFNRVINAIAAQCGDGAVGRIVDRERQRFSIKKWRREMSISSGGVALNVDEIFRVWSNASEYHYDHEKQERIDDVLGVTTSGMLRWVVAKMIFEKVHAVRNVAAISRVLVGDTSAAELENEVVIALVA